MSLANLSIRQLHQQWQNKKISAVEIAQETLEAITSTNPQLNAWTEITAQRAIQQAEQVDKAFQQGQISSPLAAIPFAVKNLFDVKNHATLAGAELFSTRNIATQDAWAVQQLSSAGALLTGMLNMDAYAYGFTTENNHFGACHNPLDLTRIAGGSSGGSAAAVAAGLVHFSLGSDTNGSIRVPASLCGVYGLKPTFGRLSRSGTHPFVASLDHIGPLARRVDDLALAYDQLQGTDPHDRFQAHRNSEPVANHLGQKKSPLRVAVLSGYFTQWANRDAQQVTQHVAQVLGAEHEVELVDAEIARSAAFILTASEGGSHYLPALKREPERFEQNSRERLLAGCMLPASWALQAQRFRQHFTQQCLAIFEQFDLLIAPATPCAATHIGQQEFSLNGQVLPVKASMGMLAQPLSFVGLPVCTVPMATPDKLTIGVQLIAAPFREDIALEAAWLLEQQAVTFSHRF